MTRLPILAFLLAGTGAGTPLGARAPSARSAGHLLIVGGERSAPLPGG